MIINKQLILSLCLIATSICSYAGHGNFNHDQEQARNEDNYNSEQHHQHSEEARNDAPQQHSTQVPVQQYQPQNVPMQAPVQHHQPQNAPMQAPIQHHQFQNMPMQAPVQHHQPHIVVPQTEPYNYHHVPSTPQMHHHRVEAPQGSNKPINTEQGQSYPGHRQHNQPGHNPTITVNPNHQGHFPKQPNGKQTTTVTPNHGHQYHTPAALNKHISMPERVKHFTRPSHLTNNYTRKHLNQAVIWNKSFAHTHKNSSMMHGLNNYKMSYHHHYYPSVYHHYHTYYGYWHNPYYRNWYSPWYRYGFFGGFWYPVRPVFLIENYFYYPDVQWFYVDEPMSVEYYTSYYPNEPLPPKWCLAAFPYKRVFFPTDSLRDLLVEASAYPQTLRCNFRVAVINFTRQLQDIIIEHFSLNRFKFQDNEIVINYYQNLQNQAIVVAGFVNHNNSRAAFEGLLDLNTPDRTMVFSPSGQQPNEEQLRSLDQLNKRIESLGGDPFTAQQQPETASPELQAGP